MTDFLFPLLAAASKSDLARQWRWLQRHYGAYMDQTVWSLIAIGIVAVIAIWVLSRRQQRGLAQIDDPLLLYRELCRAHRLSWGQQRLLQQLAREQELSNRVDLFVDPQYLKRALQAATSPKRKTSLENLHAKLFR